MAEKFNRHLMILLVRKSFNKAEKTVTFTMNNKNEFYRNTS
jgi:hypothetical protein